jgi:hypothetical protein
MCSRPYPEKPVPMAERRKSRPDHDFRSAAPPESPIQPWRVWCLNRTAPRSALIQLRILAPSAEVGSSPPSEYRAAGVMLPSVVSTRPPHHAVREEPAGQSKARGLPREGFHSTTPDLTGPASRRRDLGEAVRTCRSALPETQSVSMPYAASASLPQRNSLPSTHIRCSTVPSLRASATFARFMPRRLATSIAQRVSVEKRVGRLSTTLAAS